MGRKGGQKRIFAKTISYQEAQTALVLKNPPANAGDADSVPGLGRSPGEGHGNPLQYSCLETPMDRGVGWATVPRVASQAGLK